MTKILLVEDDQSLREIYGIRLVAEGYEIISAGDGEEALAAAVRERPDLVVSDVMMPKISGFDMLDILRSTPETKNIKVIMMTALSSEDQRKRGESLGADRYLVKSQVGIEDVVNTVHEVLGDRTGTVHPSVDPLADASPVVSAPPEVVPTMPPAETIANTPVAQPATPDIDQIVNAQLGQFTGAPVTTPNPMADPTLATTSNPSTAPTQTSTQTQVAEQTQTVGQTPVAEQVPAPVVAPPNAQPPATGTPNVQPTNPA